MSSTEYSHNPFMPRAPRPRPVWHPERSFSHLSQALPDASRQLEALDRARRTRRDRERRCVVPARRKGLPTILQVPFRVVVTAMEVGVR